MANKCVKSVKSQVVIADRCVVAESFFERFRGLIGRDRLADGEAMFFPRCNDIHMWFMSIPIDVVFLTKVNEGETSSANANPRGAGTPVYYQVASIRRNLRPWKPLPVRDGRASETLELPLGTVDRCAIGVGDQLCIS